MGRSRRTRLRTGSASTGLRACRAGRRPQVVRRRRLISMTGRRLALASRRWSVGQQSVDDGGGLVERGLDLHVASEGLQDGVADGLVDGRP